MSKARKLLEFAYKGTDETFPAFVTAYKVSGPDAEAEVLESTWVENEEQAQAAHESFVIKYADVHDDKIVSNIEGHGIFITVESDPGVSADKYQFAFEALAKLNPEALANKIVEELLETKQDGAIDAYYAGQKAHKAGKSYSDNPYPSGSMLHSHWKSGYAKLDSANPRKSS